MIIDFKALNFFQFNTLDINESMNYNDQYNHQWKIIENQSIFVINTIAIDPIDDNEGH